MNRAEFIRRLTGLLGDVSPTEREEAIQYYNDYFDDAGIENESSVIASLGSPEELARTIRAGLSDGGGTGEFTETGFSGYTQTHKDEMVKAGETGQNGEAVRQESAGQSAGMGGGAQTNDSYYQGGYYQRSGDGVYSGREDTRKYNNPYEQNSSSSSSAGSQGNATGNQAGGNYTQPKKGMSGGTLAVIVILAVLTSPIWIGLLGGFFGVAVGLLATLAAIFLAFLIIGIAMIVISIGLLITGIAMIFSVPLGGVCIVGSSLIVFSIGLVFVWLMVLMAGMAIPAFVRGVGSLCRRLFGRGGVHA